MDTSGRALVVGGSRGLGLLVAQELIERGYATTIAARDAEELDRAVQQLGPRADRVVCDVTDRSAVEALVAGVEARGPIEVVITVAGVIQAGPAEALTLEHFDEAIDIMLRGPIAVAWAVLPAMRARGRGRIATVTSIGGVIAPPHLLAYSAAKFGAVGFSDGLAAELTGTGITATTIVPGLMRTGSHERAMFVGDAAKEFAWFAPAASLPLVSIDARRAARRMVDGVLKGRPWVVITPLAWLGIRFRGLAPATTVRLMGLSSRLLPAAPSDPAVQGTVEGREARAQLSGRARRVVDALTVLGRRAADRHNERGDGARRSPR